jgi:phosphatidylserine decarboxylase
VEPIRYYHRHHGQLETEQVYGERSLRWAYGNPLGRLALHACIKRPLFSRWYGRRMDRPNSANLIIPFIREYGLDPAEFADPPESFRSFNEFFYRRLDPAARPIDPDPQSVVFPADGRHFGFQRADEVDSVFIKGQSFDIPRLLDDSGLAAKFAAGPLVLSRLCPVDYHRYHFPAAGLAGNPRAVNGPLFSVSPISLRLRLACLWQNKRVITKLQSPAAGTVLIIEIGATCVGSIHQTFKPESEVSKGAEKGYFAFGGSSVITLFEPGRVRLADDLLEWSAKNTELYARMGTTLGRTLGT